MSQRAVTDHPEPPAITNVFIIMIQGFPSMVMEKAAERHRALTDEQTQPQIRECLYQDCN